MLKRLKLAGVGCGSRTTTYMKLAAKMPDRYEIVGAADPIAWKVARIAEWSDSDHFRSFDSADALLAEDKFADVLIIGTQDQYHVDPCIKALEKGYDVVLEKPVAPTVEDVLRLEALARQLGRRVLICHVLRYTPFYEKIKQIVESGQLGDIVTLQASEGVQTFHQAHSFVRGHWSVTEKATPMIIQKSCHDLDIISWLMNRPFKRISSFGGINHFNLAHKPDGAPKYCIEGCPVGETCQYNANRYLTDQRGWLGYVYNGSATMTDGDIAEWLKTSPWGRCVYQCDNTAVDHQTTNIEFVDGTTATFTMSAFDCGRNIELWGTDAVLRAGTYTKQSTGYDIVIRQHKSNEVTRINIEEPKGGYAGHGGGDWGLINVLYEQMHLPNPDDMRSSIKASVQSHLMGYAAEHARISLKVIDAGQFRKQHTPDIRKAELV